MTRGTKRHSSRSEDTPSQMQTHDVIGRDIEVAGLIPFSPSVMEERLAALRLRSVARRLATYDTDKEKLEAFRASEIAKAESLGPKLATEAKCCISLLVDLRSQGWTIRVCDGRILVAAGELASTALTRKAQVRAGHHVERDTQLSMPSVRRFVSDLERPRPFKGRWHSIFSLMRDGQVLAKSLECAARLPQEEREMVLSRYVDPYVQAVTGKAVCELTGLRLLDVWRYFRHTWPIAYNSTPGRKMYFLIRDRAAAIPSDCRNRSARERHRSRSPREIIGLAGRVREYLRRIDAAPSRQWAVWLDRMLNELIVGRRVDDLLRVARLTPAVLAKPTSQALLRLSRIAAKARKAHWKTPQRGHHKSASGKDETTDWRTLSDTHLFRAKRAESLVVLLCGEIGAATGRIQSSFTKASQVSVGGQWRRGVPLKLSFGMSEHVMSAWT